MVGSDIKAALLKQLIDAKKRASMAKRELRDLRWWAGEAAVAAAVQSVESAAELVEAIMKKIEENKAD